MMDTIANFVLHIAVGAAITHVWLRYRRLEFALKTMMIRDVAMRERVNLLEICVERMGVQVQNNRTRRVTNESQP